MQNSSPVLAAEGPIWSVSVRELSPSPPFARSDANADGEVNLADPIAQLFALFVTGGDIPPPYPSCGVPAGPGQTVSECRGFAACP